MGRFRLPGRVVDGCVDASGFAVDVGGEVAEVLRERAAGCAAVGIAQTVEQHPDRRPRREALRSGDAERHAAA